ncbi:MAG: hypothetical protein ACNI26_17525 [Terasakiella sp.]|uniref:hypothetical protein n=1 Tax=unclassified Terasakiella TaxID=2614952 RepID=UPI003AFF7065
MQAVLIFSLIAPPILAFLYDVKFQTVISRGEFVVRFVAVMAFNIIASMIMEEALAGMEIIVVNYLLTFASSTFMYASMIGRIRSTSLRPVGRYYLVNLLLCAAIVVVFSALSPLAGFVAALGLVLLFCIYPPKREASTASEAA